MPRNVLRTVPHSVILLASPFGDLSITLGLVQVDHPTPPVRGPRELSVRGIGFPALSLRHISEHNNSAIERLRISQLQFRNAAAYFLEQASSGADDKRKD